MRVDPETVRRLNRKLGRHSEEYHAQTVQEVEVESLQADERHGFAGHKQQPAWEAELIDPAGKFVIAHVQGARDEVLIRRLLTDGASRLVNRHDIALFTDGEPSYRSLFPEIFGVPHQPPRQGPRGRLPNQGYRIPRTAALVQVVKHRQGRQLKRVEIRYAYGSHKRIVQALACLG